jgi:hypothetical protein
LLLSEGSLFLTSSAFVSVEVTPKWYAFLLCGLASALVYVVGGLFSDKVVSFKKIQVLLYPTVIVLCSVQALYGILQYFGIFPAAGGFRVTGSFDNPAGFASSLCAGFPFLFYFVFKKQAVQRWLSIAAAVPIISAIVLSASRAGMIGLLVVLVAVLFHQVRGGTKLNRHSITCFCNSALRFVFPEKRFCRRTLSDMALFVGDDKG